jgi:hypothetical protein
VNEERADDKKKLEMKVLTVSFPFRMNTGIGQPRWP